MSKSSDIHKKETKTGIKNSKIKCYIICHNNSEIVKCDLLVKDGECGGDRAVDDRK